MKLHFDISYCFISFWINTTPIICYTVEVHGCMQSRKPNTLWSFNVLSIFNWNQSVLDN